ncbi:MAG: hypothetical protein K9J37_05770 [Saprospiraceae bacterium]|nr:hypothetical protein [Saprospiraceae bacterium]MCF8249398.1 hypothetical protein [Saprospiraceae bacterium]MCF8279052.1 hypothetical protein [Bacteroidales bacterium]MCF8311527.1 hypothetical protein [Saprospiraceae bacterium]MCF8440017.1 hypothetical protein [Saprospiraceae bacterium]
MKIRIQGNSIRLRLSQPEVAAFIETGSVSESTHFGGQPGAMLTYALERSDQPELTATFSGNKICVLVPAELGVIWANSEQEVSIEHVVIPPSGVGGLRILVEKDFKCLTDRPGVDESDNFPNPSHSC